MLYNIMKQSLESRLGTTTIILYKYLYLVKLITMVDCAQNDLTNIGEQLLAARLNGGNVGCVS